MFRRVDREEEGGLGNTRWITWTRATAEPEMDEDDEREKKWDEDNQEHLNIVAEIHEWLTVTTL